MRKVRASGGVCSGLEEVRRMNFSNVTLVENTPAEMAAAVRRVLRVPRARPLGIEKYDLTHLVGDYERALGI